MASCPADYLEQWGQCVKECSPAAFLEGNKCVSHCPMGHAYNGTCVASCPREAPLNANGKCVAQCPDLFKSNGMGECICTGVWDVMGECKPSCPTSMMTVDGTYCATKCPSTHRQEGQNCTWINPCTSNQYLNSNGTCVEYPISVCGADQWYFNNTCVSACKEGEFMDMNGRCKNPQLMCEEGLSGGVYDFTKNTCDCPEGHWIQRNNSFVPPVACARIPSDVTKPFPRIDCQSFIPNTIFDFQLDNCVCDREHPVVVRVNTNDMFLPFSCEVVGTTTTIKPCDPPSYFDFMERECVLPKEGNVTVIVVTPLPTYTVRPSYTPSVSTQVSPRPSMCPEGTVMTVTGCIKVEPSMSSRPSPCPDGTVLTREGCVKEDLPTPTASRTPFTTQFPSRRPSSSVSVTRTPKPSERPNSVSSSVSASRTPKPSAAIFADITRKPLPSIIPIPPPPVAKSPAPSPWTRPSKADAVKEMLDSLTPDERPAYVSSRLSITGGNATEMAKPEKIQQMQASLACALRMPLENIRITNISYTDASGKVSKVGIDPSQFTMMGDGSTDCYKMGSSGRLLRGLQTTSGAIQVDYNIVQPSTDILSLDIDSLNDVIRTSPIMIEVASSVGGTGVLAISPESSLNAAPSAAPSGTVISSTGADSTFASFQGYVGGGIAGFVVFGGLVTALIFYYKENKRNKKLVKEKEEAVAKKQPNQIILQFNGEQIQNPMSVIQTAVNRAESTRFDYGPETSRRSAVTPLKTTHKHIVGSSV
jgi:hypothetical protein